MVQQRGKYPVACAGNSDFNFLPVAVVGYRVGVVVFFLPYPFLIIVLKQMEFYRPTAANANPKKKIR
ncbi:hypothetical protein AB9R17_03830 [Neisseria gonorrhoeae]